MRLAEQAEMVGGYAALAARLQAWGYMPTLDPVPPHEALQVALAAYQQAYAARLDDLCQRIHGRASVPDGDLGPATQLLILERNCDVPDAVQGEGEEARWPDGCVMDVTVSWDFEKFPGLSSEDTRKAWDSLSQYGDLFELAMPRRPEQYPNTRIYSALKPLPGSVLAWSNLATNSCSFRAQQAYDSTISWSLKLAVGTVRHECGHALGMNHTPSDPNSVLYPSMRGQTELNKTDIAQLERLGYKRRTSPPPPPPGPSAKVRATVFVDEKVYELVHKNGGNGGGGGGWWP